VGAAAGGVVVAVAGPVGMCNTVVKILVCQEMSVSDVAGLAFGAIGTVSKVSIEFTVATTVIVQEIALGEWWLRQ
jgi:hypothetical protein